MKLQSNCQTKDGVWGVMLSGWVGDDDAAKKECAFSHWMTTEEATALMADLTDCVVGRGAAPGTPDDTTPSQPFPKYGEPGYERPEVILDTATGLYDVIMYGCVTHSRLDVVGEREKIRFAAVERSALPNGKAASDE